MRQHFTAGLKLLLEAALVQLQHQSDQRMADHTQGLSRAGHRKRQVAKQAVVCTAARPGSAGRPVGVRGR